MTGTPGAVDPGRLVLVGGLHRSGTTPLARLLGTHPDVSVFHDTGVKEDEGQHLQDVYPAAREYGGAGRFAFDPRSHRDETDPLCTPESAQRMLASWSTHWDLERPVLVEKSPPNLVMTRFLQGLFPGARQVVCMRNPVVVALSTRKWAGPFGSLSRLLDHWLAAYEVFARDAAHLDSVHVVRYEHLVARPRPTLDALGGYLALASPLSDAGLDASRSEDYLQTWGRMLATRSPLGRWRVDRLRARFADRVAAFGYDLDDLSVCRTTAVGRVADA